MYTNEPLPLPFLATTSNRTLPISPLYFLKNKSYFTGINYLHAFNEYSNIRVNLLYNHEDEVRTDSLMNHYVAKDTITIFQRQNLHAQSDVLKGQVRYELNNSKLFIEDILTAEHSWIKSGKRYHTQTASIDENVRRQPMFLQNIINSHFTLGSQTLTLSSVIRFYHSKETLGFRNEEEEMQQTKTYSLFLRSWIGTTFNLWGNNLNIAYISENKINT